VIYTDANCASVSGLSWCAHTCCPRYGTVLCTGDTRMHDKSHTQSFDTYGRQIYMKVYLNFQYSPYS